MSKYVYEFQPNEPNNTAATIYQIAYAGGPRLLDIGSGPGIVSSALGRLAAKDVTCVDVDDDALRAAERSGVSRTAIVDLERPDWYEALPEREYDVVILADVLEHLHDPGRTLATLQEQKIVATDGLVVVSFPNVAHESILGQLLAGSFAYTETGLLDRTHIRFFTLTTMRDLLEENGFLVEQVHRTLRTMEETVAARFLYDLSDSARSVIREADGDGRTFQYILKVRPSEATAQLAMLRAELGRMREEYTRLDTAAAGLRARLADTRLILDQKHGHQGRDELSEQPPAPSRRTRDQYELVHAALRRCEEATASLEAENQRLRTEIDHMRENRKPGTVVRLKRRLRSYVLPAVNGRGRT
ncbi:class I SAM-dependent methyltransferase [Actinopolymorpha pittospori]